MRFIHRLNRGPEPDATRDFHAWLQYALFYCEPRAEVREVYSAWGRSVTGKRGERLMKRALKVLEARHAKP